jgi:GWxTD domain-containing protein
MNANHLNNLNSIKLKVICFFIISFGMFSLTHLSSCRSNKINQSSSERLYKKENNQLNAQFVVYHNTDSTSQLFYKIPNDAFVYKKTDTSDLFYAFVKLFVKVSDIDKLANPDTFSVFIFDPKKEVVSSEINHYHEFKLQPGRNYLIDVDVIDKFKKEQYAFSFYSDKSSIFSKQNFIISNVFNQLNYLSYVKPYDVVYFKSERNKEKVFQVDVFKSNFRLAPPPFSMEPMPKFSYKPDSTFLVYQQQDRFELGLPQKGFFHVKTNVDSKEGLTFFVYESVYPKIKNTEQMILSTRFIMSKKEFDICLSASDQKAMIDKFWLDIAGSHERAKELIKKYYGRVQEANKLFLSYQEGWKTDRGMIYIVFGAPTRVTKYKNGEVWTYSNNGNSAAVNFTFTKILNPFSDNDYYLERGEQYKIPWYQAVDMWRQGRIYLDN